MSGDECGKGKGGLEALAALNPQVLKILVALIYGVNDSNNALAPVPSQVKIDLPPMDLKFDGPATYLSWSLELR